MKKNEQQEESVQGTPKPARYQFTMAEVQSLVDDHRLLETFKKLADQEENKGKAASYLLTIARAVNLQLTLA